jgi:ABC-type sulfate/molybdate transport systems ATPase subunit
MRPHELEIERYKNGVPSLEAKITRIHEAGSTAKISTVTADGHELHVELTLDRLRELGLGTDQTVFVRPKTARIFVHDGEAI